MPISSLTSGELHIHIAPDALGFSNTSELVQHPLPWV